MDSGLVFGDCRALEASYGIPYVFDCTTKRLFNVAKDFFSWTYSVVKDRVFVFDRSTEGPDERYLVAEYTWESSTSKLKEWNISETSIQCFPASYEVMLFASCDFVLFFEDNISHSHHHHFIGRYDLSAKRWDDLPALTDVNRIYMRSWRGCSCVSFDGISFYEYFT